MSFLATFHREGGPSRKGTHPVKRFRYLRFRLFRVCQSIFRQQVVVVYLAGAKSMFDPADTIVSGRPELTLAPREVYRSIPGKPVVTPFFPAAGNRTNSDSNDATDRIGENPS